MTNLERLTKRRNNLIRQRQTLRNIANNKNEIGIVRDRARQEERLISIEIRATGQEINRLKQLRK